MMKRVPVVFVLFFGLFLIDPTLEQCLTSNDLGKPSQFGHLDLYTGQQKFSLNLLQAINKFNPNENIFFSPYSTYHALLMTFFISANDTEKYLKKTLQLNPNQDKADIYSAYKLDAFTTRTGLKKNGTYEFTNANRIYVAEQIPLRTCILSLFGNELLKFNFRGNPEAARTSINQWVEERTHTMIKDLLPPGTIDESTNLVLVNAAYFKGKWENKFNPAETKQEVFHISPSKQAVVDMMHLEGTFNYAVSENLMAHILELPYEGEDISMYILLPPFAKEDAIDTVLRKLTIDTFKEVVNGSLLPREVKVSLPKFTLEHTIELAPVLYKIGAGVIFEPNADFSTLSESGELSLGRGIHKARIEVSEEGTKAAAATVLFTFRSIRPLEPAEFKCNHPFIYLIFDKTEQAVLFTGIFRRPPY